MSKSYLRTNLQSDYHCFWYAPARVSDFLIPLSGLKTSFSSQMIEKYKLYHIITPRFLPIPTPIHIVKVFHRLEQTAPNTADFTSRCLEEENKTYFEPSQTENTRLPSWMPWNHPGNSCPFRHEQGTALRAATCLYCHWPSRPRAAPSTRPHQLIACGNVADTRLRGALVAISSQIGFR